MTEVEEINLIDEELNLNHIRNKGQKKVENHEQSEKSKIVKEETYEENETYDDEVDDDKKSDLIDHILSYKKEPEFSEMLSDIPDILSHYNIEQLQKILKQIKKRLSRQSPMVEQGVYMACNMIEKLGTSKGFYLQGFANTMMLNPIAKRAIKELSIDYAHKSSLGPEQRLLGAGITTALSLHAVGSAKAQMREMMKLDEQVDVECVNVNEVNE